MVDVLAVRASTRSRMFHLGYVRAWRSRERLVTRGRHPLSALPELLDGDPVASRRTLNGRRHSSGCPARRSTSGFEERGIHAELQLEPGAENADRRPSIHLPRATLSWNIHFPGRFFNPQMCPLGDVGSAEIAWSVR